MHRVAASSGPAAPTADRTDVASSPPRPNRLRPVPWRVALPSADRACVLGSNRPARTATSRTSVRPLCVRYMAILHT